MAQKPVSGSEARQGGLGRPVLLVLSASLVLLAIYVIGLVIWAETDLKHQPSDPNHPVAGQERSTDGQGK